VNVEKLEVIATVTEAVVAAEIEEDLNVDAGKLGLSKKYNRLRLKKTLILIWCEGFFQSC
jgi:hypothetical protein